MILANVRGRLRGADLRVVLLALGGRDATARARWQQRLETEGPDVLLDQRDLLGALLAIRSLVIPSAPLFSYVAVRHMLLAAGVDDRALTDYLAALLLEFGHHDRHIRPAAATDQTYNYLVDLVSDLSAVSEDGVQGFLLLAHLGNYSLWLAGLFPDYIEARHKAGGPDLPYYDGLGRQGFDLASRHALAERYGVAGIYREAADRFPSLRVAFNRLSDRVLFPNVFTAEKVIRNL